MAGQQAEGLDIEDEAWRRAIGPQAGVALGEQRVIGRVDLDGLEMRRKSFIFSYLERRFGLFVR
jgi:hypothetical protein